MPTPAQTEFLRRLAALRADCALRTVDRRTLEYGEYTARKGKAEAEWKRITGRMTRGQMAAAIAAAQTLDGMEHVIGVLNINIKFARE